MVNHEVAWVQDAGLAEVNGHEHVICRNITRRQDTLQCQTCGWIGPTRQWRWSEKLTDDWRQHAGDIATGTVPTHGQAGNGCHCWACARATRDAQAAEVTP
jgi:hypothetical protein